MSSLRLATVLLILAILCVYLQGLSGPWLYDDQPNLVKNSLLYFDHLVFDEWRTAAFSSESGPLRRPLAMLTFAAGSAISGGLQVTATKLVNILIHLATAYSLFVLFRRLLCAPAMTFEGVSQKDVKLIAGAAAIFWCLHPLHVSTVLYSVQRMAQLSALLAILGLLLFMHFRSRWAIRGASGGEVAAALLWLLLVTFLASLAKENGVLLLLLVLVIEVTLFRGVWNGIQCRWLGVCAWAFLLLPMLGLVATALYSPDWLSAKYFRRDFSLHERVLTQSRLLWNYLYWFAWPNPANMGLHHDDIAISRSLFEPLSTLLSILAWLMALGVAVVLRHRYPLLLFALLFYLVAHSMESSVWPLMMVFEHRNYLPSIALFFLLAWLLVVPGQKSKQYQPLLPLASVSILLLAFLFVRVSAWTDEFRLNQIAVENHPRSANAHHVFANTLLREYQSAHEEGSDVEIGKHLLAGARFHFEEASRLAPQDVGALVSLYHLDSSYFQDLGTHDKWMISLESILDGRRLGSDDIHALKEFMRCLAENICRADGQKVERLIGQLRLNYPKWTAIDLIEYAYLQASGAESVDRIAMLTAALERHPRNQVLLYRLLGEYVAAESLGAAYETGRRLLQADPHRLQLRPLVQTFPEVVRLSSDAS